MSVTRVLLSSVAVLALLATLPAETKFGPHPAFARGGGGDGAGGGGAGGGGAGGGGPVMRTPQTSQ
jgi:hypothetical protein